MTRKEFEDAVSASEKRLYIAAFSVTANAEDAKDAVSDALLYAWQHRDELRERGKFDAWLLKITYSQAKMIRRKNRRYESLDALSENFKSETDKSNLEFFDILNRAKIDDEQRRILTLRFLYGYSLPEIAKMTDKNPETVKTKYRRALQKMAGMKGLK